MPSQAFEIQFPQVNFPSSKNLLISLICYCLSYSPCPCELIILKILIRCHFGNEIGMNTCLICLCIMRIARLSRCSLSYSHKKMSEPENSEIKFCSHEADVEKHGSENCIPYFQVLLLSSVGWWMLGKLIFLIVFSSRKCR